MKKLLIGLIALTSISAYSNECTINIQPRNLVVKALGVDETASVIREVKVDLLAKGYQLTNDENANLNYELAGNLVVEDSNHQKLYYSYIYDKENFHSEKYREDAHEAEWRLRNPTEKEIVQKTLSRFVDALPGCNR